MLKARNLLKSAGILLLCVFTWITIRAVGYLMSDYPNENLNYVPEEAFFAARVDGRELAESTLFTLLLNAKDEEVIDLLRAKGNQLQGKKTSMAGVNPLSDIVVFQLSIDNKEMTGVLFNLLNEDKFLSEMPEKFAHSIGVFAQGNVGLLLSGNDFSVKTLNQKAKEIMQHKAEKPHVMFYANGSKKRLLEIHLHDGKDANSQETSLSFEQNQFDFNLSGTYQSKGPIVESSSPYFLTPKGLHISNYSIPNHYASVFQDFIYENTSLHLPEMKAFSLNYSGLDIINHPSGFVPLPDMDIVIEFKQEFNIRNFIDSIIEQNEFTCLLTNNSLSIEDKTMYFQQLDSTTVYLGRSKSPNFTKKNSNCVVFIKGNPTPLCNVRGGGLMTNLLAMTPGFQASRTLSEHTEYIDLKISKTSAKTAKISGEMKFKQGYYPINEVLRFLLISSN